jgi:hypothetical protein
MKFFRYRRPSWKTILGVTQAKKRLKKDLGITTLLKPLRWWPNQKRSLKRKLGYESEAGRIIRDGMPKPGGCLLLLLLVIALSMALMATFTIGIHSSMMRAVIQSIAAWQAPCGK